MTSPEPVLLRWQRSSWSVNPGIFFLLFISDKKRGRLCILMLAASLKRLMKGFCFPFFPQSWCQVSRSRKSKFRFLRLRQLLLQQRSVQTQTMIKNQTVFCVWIRRHILLIWFMILHTRKVKSLWLESQSWEMCIPGENVSLFISL